MNSTDELPQYNNETLAACTAAELIEIMIRDEDRAPRNVIDECAQRGEQILDALTPFTEPNHELENKTPGYWWLRLHTIMILGLIPGERAGLLLVDVTRNISLDEQDDLQDWFSGYWPALMQNKPASVIDALRDICMDSRMPYFIRADVIDVVIADALKQGEQALEKTLDWAAQLAGDIEEDWDYRLSTASTLLDFPRERYRKLLDTLADEHGMSGVHFNKDNVITAYAKNEDRPGWQHFNNPWRFYEPQEIENRQQRWQEELFLEENNLEFGNLQNDSQYYHWQEPYQRETPKIGRNDPCYCGSGKKYKKCCLNKAQEALH